MQHSSLLFAYSEVCSRGGYGNFIIISNDWRLIFQEFCLQLQVAQQYHMQRLSHVAKPQETVKATEKLRKRSPAMEMQVRCSLWNERKEQFLFRIQSCELTLGEQIPGKVNHFLNVMGKNIFQGSIPSGLPIVEAQNWEEKINILLGTSCPPHFQLAVQQSVTHILKLLHFLQNMQSTTRGTCKSTTTTQYINMYIFIKQESFQTKQTNKKSCLSSSLPEKVIADYY